MYNTNSDIRFKNAMLKSDYSNEYILFKGRITITGWKADKINKVVIFKNFALFINCKREINNKQMLSAIYNLIEYSDSFSKTIWKLMTILETWAKW